MISQQLYNYIVNNLSRGYSVIQIKNFLLNYGYDKNLVSDTLNAVRLKYPNYFNISNINSENDNTNTKITNNTSSSNSNNINRQNHFLKYIQTQVSKGYDLFTIRQYLINIGYNKYEIDNVIDLYSKTYLHKNNSQTFNFTNNPNSSTHNIQDINSKNNINNTVSNDKSSTFSSHNFQNVKHEFQISSSTITKIGVMFIVLICITFGLFFILNNDSATLDVILNIDKFTYEPGDDVTFSVNLLNVGTHSKAFDIKLTRTLVNTDTMAQLSSQSDTFALSVSATKDYSFKLPDNIPPGNYKITVSTSYGGVYSASADSTFVVVEKSNPNLTQDDIINDSNSDLNLINDINKKYISKNNKANNYDSLNSDNEFEDYINNLPPSLPKNIDPKSSIIINNLKNLASKDDNSVKIAQDSCKKLSNSLSSDYCLKQIAFVANNSISCDLINDTNTKDQCYLYFVNQQDYTLCNKLASDDSRSACLELRNLNMLSQYTGTPIDKNELLNLVTKLNLTSTSSENNNLIKFKEKTASETAVS